MSIESPPSRYKEPYDSLDQACYDYETIALYTSARIFTERGVSRELETIYQFNVKFAPDLMNRLLQRGVYLEPVNEKLTLIDVAEQRMIRIFSMGASLALQTADNFARENNIDPKKWREFWANLPDAADATCEIPNGKTLTPMACRAVGESLLEWGKRYTNQMDENYIELVRDVINECPKIWEDAGVFEASFGYVMGNAERIINTLISERRIDEDVARVTAEYTTSSFDKDFKQFLRIVRRLDK